MQIQKNNSYNQRPNVNFKGKLINDPNDFKVLSKEGAQDIFNYLSEVVANQKELPGDVYYVITEDVRNPGVFNGKLVHEYRSKIRETKALKIPLHKGPQPLVGTMQSMIEGSTAIVRGSSLG